MLGSGSSGQFDRKSGALSWFGGYRNATFHGCDQFVGQSQAQACALNVRRFSFSIQSIEWGKESINFGIRNAYARVGDVYSYKVVRAGFGRQFYCSFRGVVLDSVVDEFDQGLFQVFFVRPY